MAAKTGDLQTTAAGVFTPETKNDIELALKKISKKQRLTRKYYNYYAGIHRIKFSSEKYKDKFGDQLKEFVDNLCRVCVTTPADRLEITGFTDEKSKAVFVEGWELWKYSSMPRLAVRLWREAFKTGDAFMTVWADENGRARLYVEDSRQCAVWYNNETMRVRRGAKLWRDELDEKFYLTIYYQDRIEKFISRGKFKSSDLPTSAGAFMMREVDGETPDDLKNESGVCPMFHFGIENSILDDVMPLNDAMNKELADLLVSSESNSRKQRWTTGITYPNNPETGKPIFPYDDHDPILSSAKETAKFGEFGQISLEDFLKAAERFALAIARVTGIPSYYFQLEKTAPPSGEALVKAETRLTALIRNAQNEFGEPMSQAISFGLWIDSKANDKMLKENLIQVNWTAANPQTEKEKVDLANSKKNLGVDDKTLQSEIGYSDADITKIEKNKAAQDAATVERNKKMFDAGDALSV